MQVLVPISSRTKFFPEDEYFFPKPLIEIDGKPMIQCVIENIKNYVSNPKFIFIIDSMDCSKFSLDRMLSILGGENSVVIQKNTETAGALCSALLAIDFLEPNEPLLISNSDTILSDVIDDRLALLTHPKTDAGVFTFKSVHPRWSYVRGDGDRIQQVYEKEVISNQAIAGLYYFKNTSDFIQAAQEVIINDVSLDGSYYISSTLNQIILRNKSVKSVQLEPSQVHTFYSPEAIEMYRHNRDNNMNIKSKNINIVIPAAGLGSRFAKEGWRKPKPFIDVCGQPMIQQVMRNLNIPNCKFSLLFREEHINEYPESIEQLQLNGANIKPVANLTEGTACTVLTAEEDINNDDILIVANSDQIVEFDMNDYVKDCIERNLDGSILVFKDANRDPKWSFAKVSDSGLVTEVAEKKPISNLATVGIYMFRTGRSFVRGAIEMIVANERVNNEFYTCPVYNYLIKNGCNIGVYEIDFEKMHGIGTPEDLRIFLRKNGNEMSADEPC